MKALIARVAEVNLLALKGLLKDRRKVGAMWRSYKMDKQKQIEEIIDIQRKNCLGKGVGACDDADCNACSAFAIYNAGYRNIPEGAVVLTETEYNDLLSDEVKTIERDIAEYWATEEVATVAKELHKEGYRKIDDHAILVLRKAKCLEQKIRMETAEKFAEQVKMAFYYHFDEFIPSIMEKDIDEIAKEIMEGKV